MTFENFCLSNEAEESREDRDPNLSLGNRPNQCEGACTSPSPPRPLSLSTISRISSLRIRPGTACTCTACCESRALSPWASPCSPLACLSARVSTSEFVDERTDKPGAEPDDIERVGAVAPKCWSRRFKRSSRLC